MEVGLRSSEFQPLRYGLGAWTEHIYFAYDLVAELKPQVLVELGTDRGESYFAFCQSVQENETSTRCFAVDHWRGDPHAGSYDETTYEEVMKHNCTHYSDFSTLLRMDFDQALSHFAPESIDLLHIDGHHAEEAVRHDLQNWLPKLRPGGILLMHDVTMRGRGFGVWKVWDKLQRDGRSFVFSDPPGLGLWQKPPTQSVPPLLEKLFTAPGELVSYYKHRNRILQEKMALQWLDGSIRSAPMAGETVIQVFWTDNGSYCEEQSVDARIGHELWKEVTLRLPTAAVIGLRVDFFSALTRIEIASIEVATAAGAPIYRADSAEQFDLISLGGDCVRLSLRPFVIQVTGMDPQLYLPEFSSPVWSEGWIVTLRLRVLTT